MQSQDNIALVGVLAGMSVVLGYMENFIPTPIPFVRIGLANIPILIAVMMMDSKSAISIAVLKSIIIPIVSGNFFVKFIIGLPSSMISTTGMIILFYFLKKHISAVSVGALGGYLHIAVQVVLIKLFFIKYLDIYSILPYFSVLGTVTGIFTGLVTNYIKSKYFEGEKCFRR